MYIEEHSWEQCNAKHNKNADVNRALDRCGKAHCGENSSRKNLAAEMPNLPSGVSKSFPLGHFSHFIPIL